MSYFRVHPSINFARVGNSSEYYLAPETAAGELIDKESGLFGGLPVKPNTDNTPIDDSDFRDADGKVKRQAARFRLFAYDQPQEVYPAKDLGSEVKPGDIVGGKRIKDIVWQVHLANKKNNNYSITSEGGDEEGIVAYENGNTPPVRNNTPEFGSDLASENRLNTLVMDAGPRAMSVVSSSADDVQHFNQSTAASYVAQNGVIYDQPDYPISFPDNHFKMFNPLGTITSLGEMLIEKDTGRLIVTGGYGKASAMMQNGVPPKLDDAIDNDFWFDDTSDGPVCATIIFEDGSTEQAVHGWVVCTDPGYAPQTRNVVSTWDDVYDTWVQHLGLLPELFSNGYQDTYNASFNGDVLPVFHGAFLQRWNTALPNKGVNGHDFVAQIKPTDNPKEKLPSFQQLIRKPSPPGTKDAPSNEDGVPGKMPLALGDAMKSFLSVTETQYFLMNQWYEGKSVEAYPPLGKGEYMDRMVLENCLGGRYSPGIDLTFIVRDVNLYVQDWQGETGPFRINMQPLDYSSITANDGHFLGVGYVPLRTSKVEPGDLCKFMSQPWHTDYNSCATHTPDPNPPENNTLYWSWPAQRPVSVYPKEACKYDSNTNTWSIGNTLFSVRGDGTQTPYPQQQGRFQCYFEFVENWHKVGFVIQGLQVHDSEHNTNYGSDKFIEVESQFAKHGDTVEPWPTAVEEGYEPPTNCGP
ncbi:LodA/GoxA family CTQ-dependent oxidase [Alteromonas sp. S015]|uniref:LodA/GoxA family CTQ-dependent oxidase n=1 Tax=Alteromonas sp. S015 TaxID=3117401 RepID=UPI002FE22B4E